MPGVLPDLFTHCPRCGGGKAEPYGSLRYGKPCDTCYGTGEVLTEAGRAVWAVTEWQERVAHVRRAAGEHPWFPLLAGEPEL